MNSFLRTDKNDSCSTSTTSRPINTTGLTYDALGRMVEQNKAGTNFQVVYLPSGSKFAMMKGATLVHAFAPLPGGGQAIYIGSGLQYYRHGDWLGSSRFASKTNQTLYADTAYAPFGEPYAQSGTSDVSFTGMNQDTVSNLYDFMYREYNPTQGRWPSPDPAGLAAANPVNPQSWNRYSYVLNYPLGLVDPLGLWCVWQDGHDPDPEDGGSGVDDCLAHGGVWDPSDTILNCDFAYTCNTTYGVQLQNVCGDVTSCIAGGSQSVVVNGGDPNSGSYGTGLPSPGCGFFYRNGTFIGEGCGNGSPLNIPQSKQGAVALQLAGIEASHYMGCIAKAAASLIPFSEDFKSNGPSTPMPSTSLDSINAPFGRAGEAQIVLSLTDKLPALESLLGKLGPLGSVVGGAAAAAQANACFDQHP